MAATVDIKHADPAPTTGADKLPQAVVQPPVGGTSTVTVDTTQTGKTTEAPKADRPAWLPEGFESPEKLAEAYRALQATKEQKPAEVPADKKGADEALQKAGLKIDEFAAEYAKDGKLSDDAYKKLAGAGISKETVDAYIAGQQARANEYRTAVAKAVGGEEEMAATLKWAETALTPAEIEAANKALAAGDAAQASLVLSGLHARRLATDGVEPRLVGGRAAPGRDAVQGYESSQQWINDVNSRAYKTDPAFRAQVERRVAASKF